MRNPLLTIVILILAFIFTSCATVPEDISSPLQTTYDEDPLLFPAQEYTEIGEAFAGGRLIDIKPAYAGIPEENVFAADEHLVSYDYVMLFSIKGNIAFYLENQKCASCVFGSEVYNDISDYKVALTTMNISISEALGVDIRGLIFTGENEIEDDWEQLFEGHGSFVSEYKANGYSVSVKGIGVNGTATIVVECHKAGNEG